MQNNIADKETAFRKKEIDFIANDVRSKYDTSDIVSLYANGNPFIKKSSAPVQDIGDQMLSHIRSKTDVGGFSNIKQSEIYTPLSDGSLIAKFDKIPEFATSAADIEETYALTQGTGEKWGNGLTKFLGKTLTGVVGGTIGSVAGLMKGVNEGSFQATYDNNFNDWLDDLNTKMDYQLPNYYTQQDKEAGFLSSMGTANFWANDFLGGLSFTTGALVSEGLWAWATGGTSLGTTAARLAPKLARLGRLTGRTAEVAQATNMSVGAIKAGGLAGFLNQNLPAKLATNLGKAGDLANTARFTYTSAGYESGFEARHYMKEAQEDFISSFQESNGRMPTHEEQMTFQENLNKSANALFGFNMAIVGSSNLAIFGKTLGIKSPLSFPQKWANESLLGIGTRKTAEGTVEAIKATRAQNILAKSWTVGKAPVIEGLWEEGMQSSGSNTAKSWVQNTYDPKQMEKTISLGLGFIEGIGETYGSKEGWKEIGIGMLIGLLSGTGTSLARGKGVFGDLSDARKNAENEAEIRNNYSAEKLLERIHTANRVTAFGEAADLADEKGDITGAELSRSSAMIAHITGAYNFGYMDEAMEEVKQGIQTMDDAMLMKQYGLESQSEVASLKDTLFNDYQRLAKEYKKQRDFVGYMINDKSKEFGKDSSVNQVQEALAYELTLGARAHEFSGELLTELRNSIAKNYSTNGESISNALQVQDVLLSASRQVRKDFKQSQGRLKAARKEREALDKQRLALEATKGRKKEGETFTDLDRLNATMANIEASEKEIQRLEAELEGVLSAAVLENPYATSDQPFVSAKELEEIDTHLGAMQGVIDNFKRTNAREGHRLEGLLKEYQKSKTAFTRYADLSRQLSDPNLGLRGRRNIITELRSDKEPKAITREFIEGMATNMDRIKQERIDEAAIATSKFRTERKASMERPAPETKRVATMQDIIEDNPYLFDYVGTADNVKKPTESEIEEYKALLSRIKRSRKIDNTKATQNAPDYYARKGVKIPLSKNEMARFQELNQLMSDWKMFETAVNAEGISLADLAEQELSRSQEVVQPNVQSELTVDDYVAVASPSESVTNPQGQEYRKSSVIQTYENIKVQVIDAMYYFSHLRLTSLLKSDYKVIMKTPKTFDENGFVTEWNKPVEASYGEIFENQNKYGTNFVIQTKSGDLSATVTSQGRLQIPVAEFSRAKEELGMDIFKQLATRTTYADLYEVNAEGDYVQKASDFGIEQELGAEPIQYAPEEVMELQPGTSTFFKVNLQDSYNADLREAYDNGTITYETVVDQVKVYNTAANEKVLGDLKSNQDIIEGSENFLNIRKMAADILIGNTPKQDMVTIPYVAKVKHVLIGVPNLTMIKTDDGMIPQSIELTDGAIEQIVDYGYINNGTLTLKNKTKDVRTDFVSKLDKKTNVPVIIFQQGGYMVAYPVSLIKRDANRGAEAQAVLSSSLNNSEKATILNTMFAENGIAPSLSYVTEDNQNMFNEDGTPSTTVSLKIQQLSEAKDTADVQTWMTDDHSRENLKDEVTITVDLEDRVLKSPKVIIDFDEAQKNEVGTPWYDLWVATGSISDEKIHDIANRAIEAGLNAPVGDAFFQRVEALNNRILELKNLMKPLEAELKAIKAPKGKRFSPEQDTRRNEIMDILEPMQDESRTLYRDVALINDNPSLAMIAKEDVFTAQELDVYNTEKQRINQAIDEIVKLDSQRQQQADQTKRKECS